MTEISLDAKGLHKLSNDLHEAEPALAKAFTDALREAANLIAAQARVNASFSSHIPGTIRPIATTQFATRVSVRAGPGTKPHAGEAAALENHGVPGTVRHPVYGNREAWVATKAHPFLTPAGVEKTPEAEAMIVRAVDVFARLVER